MSARTYSPAAGRGRVLTRWLLTAGLTALGLTGLAHPGEAGARQAVEAGGERYGRDHGLASYATTMAAHRAERERYERGVQEAETARLRYEADLARHRQELARSRQARDEYESRLARRETVPAPVRGRPEPGSPTPVSAGSCQERLERNRRQGRLLGGLLGGVAGVVAGRRGNTAALAAALIPAGVLLGDAIASLLDCDEQQKAVFATEQAISGGVGTTTSWTSATRPGVTGSSTVTAAAPSADGVDCLTVTDVVIVDGEETRAPKRMCRRPPANRYVRV